MERAAPALRRRRRRGHERLRARRARARRERQRLRRRAGPVSGAAARRRRAATRRSATAPRTCPRARTSSCLLLGASARRTSSARAARERGLPERPRAELLGELTALRRTIAVAGHARQDDDRLDARARAARRGPATRLARRRRRSAAGSRTRDWGEGEWLVVEADESDRSMLSLQRRDRAADERRARPPRDLRLARASCAARSREFLRGPRRAVIWDRPELLELRGRGELVGLRRARGSSLDAGGSRFRWRGHDVTLAVPGAHNALNAAGALEAARLAGAEASAAIAGLGGVHGRRAALSAARHERRAARASTTTTPTTRRRSRRRSRARARSSTQRLVAVFQPHLFSRTALARARVRRGAGAAPTWSSCSTSTRRASAPRTSRASAAC